jgi:beta-1,4-mannosyltransferase
MEFGVRVDDEDQLKSISRAVHASGGKPDIVHIQATPRFDCSPMQVLRCAMFCFRLFRLRMLGVRLVWTIHDISHHEARHPRVELAISRLIFRRADALILHSNAARKAVERQWNVKCDNRVFVIPHGNYIGSYPNHANRNAAREKLRVSPGKLVVLFLGIIRPYKGVLELIGAFKGLSASDIELVIVGKPLSDEFSEKISSAIGSAAEIHYFPGHVNDDEIQDYFNAADVVVFPYTKALTSGALILAMSFGRACIAPRMGALEDTLDDEGGFLYDPEVPGALREALMAASGARSRLEAMGKHNYQNAEGWPWSETARMTAEVYRGCLAKQDS